MHFEIQSGKLNCALTKGTERMAAIRAPEVCLGIHMTKMQNTQYFHKAQNIDDLSSDSLASSKMIVIFVRQMFREEGLLPRARADIAGHI